MNTSLVALNSFRNAEGLEPFADFRKARHAAMLETFEDEYEVASMNLVADLSDADPDYQPMGEEEAERLASELEAEGLTRDTMPGDTMPETAEKGDEPDALLVDDEGNTIRESEFVAQQEDQAKIDAVQQIAQQTKLPSYKQMVRDHGGNSKIESPVEFIRGFLDTNPAMTRKQAVAALVSVHGVNYSTARTQYQKWFAKQK